MENNKPTLLEYNRIHYWIRSRYGVASKCEFIETCNRKSKSYDWALKKGCSHTKDVENYIQLCKSCHAIYDKKGIGRIISKETRKKMSIAKKGVIPINKGNDSKVLICCAHCKKSFKAYKSKKSKYCSYDCRYTDMTNKPSRNTEGNNGRN